jgi:hypothetical protein
LFELREAGLEKLQFACASLGIPEMPFGEALGEVAEQFFVGGFVAEFRLRRAEAEAFFHALADGGKEVAERMEGAYLPDFYGTYLEERLAQGRKAL